MKQEHGGASVQRISVSRVTEKVQSRFSTLGGVDIDVGSGRAARHAAEELILTLSPK